MRKVSAPIDKAVVLIIDDMQAMRQLIKTALRHMGFKHIAECSNGLEAAKRLRLMNVDLVICDYDMPEMNGLELLTDIRKKEHLKNTPFVMLTANASADLIHKSIITGVDSYIVKPFQPLALCKKINSMLEAPLDNIA